MKASTKIAAIRRRIERMEEDKPHFEVRIKDLKPEEQALARQVFRQVLAEDKNSLLKLLSADESED